MIRVLTALLVLLVMSTADAAPRWRRQHTTPQYRPATQVEAYTSTGSSHYAGGTGSAQGVAEMMASRGVMQHFGGNSGYEGVGMGSSPDEALNNCCYSRSGMRVVDQGVACGRNGKWYACKRYR